MQYIFHVHVQPMACWVSHVSDLNLPYVLQYLSFQCTTILLSHCMSRQNHCHPHTAHGHSCRCTPASYSHKPSAHCHPLELQMLAHTSAEIMLGLP
jgi:hypothetical protein